MSLLPDFIFICTGFGILCNLDLSLVGRTVPYESENLVSSGSREEERKGVGTIVVSL